VSRTLGSLCCNYSQHEDNAVDQCNVCTDQQASSTMMTRFLMSVTRTQAMCAKSTVMAVKVFDEGDANTDHVCLVYRLVHSV